MIFDTHCHLNSEELYNRLDEVIKSSRDVGVDKFLVVGWDKKSSFLAVELAEKYDFIYAAIGFHPCDIFDLSEEDLEQTMALFSHPKVVAIGEIGLDYHYEGYDKQLQKELFVKQINLALEINKPICVHCRDAYDDMVEIFKSFKQLPKGVIHCFSGSYEQAKVVVDMGFLIGIDGPCTYPKSNKLKRVIENVPLEKILVETDCPYLAPQLYRGTRNEPSYVVEVAKKIAEIKNMPFEQVCDITTKNTINLYNLK